MTKAKRIEYAREILQKVRPAGQCGGGCEREVVQLACFLLEYSLPILVFRQDGREPFFLCRCYKREDNPYRETVLYCFCPPDLLQEMLPHVGIGEFTETRKAFFVGYMVHRCVLCSRVCPDSYQRTHGQAWNRPFLASLSCARVCTHACALFVARSCA